MAAPLTAAAVMFAQHRGGGVDAEKSLGGLSLWPLVLKCESIKLFWELKHTRVLLLTHPLSSWVALTRTGLAYQFPKHIQLCQRKLKPATSFSFLSVKGEGGCAPAAGRTEM